jgi:hypothetical protein
MSLLDQDACVVDALRQAKLVDTSLETALEEVFDLEGQDVIELHARLVEDTDTNKTTNQSVSLEEALGVFFIECEKLSG